MIDELSPQLKHWLEINADLIVALAPVLQVSKPHTLMSKKSLDNGISETIIAQISEAINQLGAKKAIKDEFITFSSKAKAKWKKIPSGEQVALAKLMAQLDESTEPHIFIGSIAKAIASKSISVSLATSMLLGVNSGTVAARPLLCYVCFAVPIWGLTCLLLKRCRDD